MSDADDPTVEDDEDDEVEAPEDETEGDEPSQLDILSPTYAVADPPVEAPVAPTSPPEGEEEQPEPVEDFRSP